MGGGKGAPRQYRGVHNKVFVWVHMVLVWLFDWAHEWPRWTFHRWSGRKFDDILLSSPHEEYVVLSSSKWTSWIEQKNVILQKNLNENRTDSDKKLHNTLWSYQTTYKMSILSTPFRLGFGLEAVMPMEFQIPSLRIQVREQLSEIESEKIRLATMCELEEHQIGSLLQLELEQRWQKAFVD